ncbi:MAG: hypothetical protein AAGU25_05855 [bacterium]
MKEKRGYWFLLTGLVVGLALGLLYAWLLNPVSYIDTSPSTLRQDYRDQYRLLIARAFAFNQDRGRASARLRLLGDEDPVQALVVQAQQVLAQGGSRYSADVLAVLSQSLVSEGVSSPVEGAGVTQDVTLAPVASSTQEPMEVPATETPTLQPATKTPGATFTPRSVTTIAPTENLPFILAEKSNVCNPSLPPRLLQVEVLDENEEPLFGVKITVSWEGGEDTFFTGMHPEMGPGYADFSMVDGVTYSLRVGNTSKPVAGLSVISCNLNDGSSYPGGIKLIFK